MKSLLPSIWGRGALSGEGRDDPFHAFHRDIDRMFEEFGRNWRMPALAGRESLLKPAIDVSETDNAIEVAAELPGIDEKDIEVEVANNTLTIKGEKKSEKEEKEKDYHLVERSYGSFLRSVPLPYDVDPEKITAKFSKGVLTVTMPKPPEVKEKVKKVKVTNGS
ncbi:MAG: Hsp20/alpha crystallin family protein [Kiloniellales bacterium]|nr:Hsp20/alpha crystallin family protein [Kiloniellales bacterium]